MSDPVREQILSEAKKLFYVYGFKKVSMDEIASACKISKKTLYQIYPSKDGLIRECVEITLNDKIGQIHRIIDSGSSVSSVFKGIFEVFRSLNQFVSEPMMQDIRMMPALWNEIEEKRMTVFERFGTIIEKGKLDGSIKEDLNVDLFLRIYMNILQRFANPSFFSELNLRPSDFIEQIKLVIFEGIFIHHTDN